jgi:hypothetical protein
MLLDENEIQELKGIARDGLYQGPKTVTDLCDTIEAQKQAMEDVRVLVSCGNCTDAELLINRVMRTDPIDYHNPSDIAEIEQLKGEIEDLEEDIDEAERESFEKIERMEELLKRSKIAIEYAPGAFANVTIKKIDDLLGGVGDDIR